MPKDVQPRLPRLIRLISTLYSLEKDSRHRRQTRLLMQVAGIKIVVKSKVEY